ncbi:MAG: AraC family transcriptional regulator [Acidimicrobiales bacterium]|nr:AraC family transcriptional regulator [Acidimicrobiales bacterium]
MEGVFYCPSFLTEPWGLELPAMPGCVWFHAVTEGECTLEVDGEERRVVAGELVLVPHGNGHRGWGQETASTPLVTELPHTYITDNYALLRHGGGGRQTHLVCGGIRLDHPAARQLLQCLPGIIHITPPKSVRSDVLQSTLRALEEEMDHARPGAEAVISRLCDIVVIHAIRTWIETDPAAQTGWLGALQDPQIGTAIAAIHRAPADDWSVASLAAHVGMSRSAFSARFTDLVGESVMRYITTWRMNVALDLLQRTDLTVAAVAARVGYESEAAFSRAFKRVIGKTASSVRLP